MTRPRPSPRSGAQPSAPARGTASATAMGNGAIMLFSVQFSHSYYNASGNKCPDFKVVPTPACAALMARLGMIFRDQGTGFSVYIPQSRIAAMMSYIISGFCATSPGYGYWAKLSFFLVLNNPNFVGITALPIDTCPTQQNFYACNLQTATSGSTLLLGNGAGLSSDALYPVTGTALSPQAAGNGTISISDISGAPVCSASVTAGNPASLSIAGSPYGLYKISGDPTSAYDGPAAVAYVPPSPLTSGVIDLLLTQPVAGSGSSAAFPVAPLTAPPPAGYAPAATPQTVNLTLPFDARQTYWQYYVVSQGARGQFSQSLSIAGNGSKFKQSTEQLPSGDQAVLFAATSPLPLSQKTTQRFKLTGQRQGGGGSRDDITVDWLPSAPATPVWPASSGDALAGNSEIYVYV